MPRRYVRVRSWVFSLLLAGADTELIIRRAFARPIGYFAHTPEKARIGLTLRGELHERGTETGDRFAVDCGRAPALSMGRFASGQPRSTVAEGIGVAVDRRRAAKMSVENLRSFGEITLLHEVDHSLHGFAFIDRVGNHAFEARAQANGLLRLLRRNTIDGISIVLDQDNIVFDDLLAEFDELCGVLRDLKHLCFGLV